MKVNFMKMCQRCAAESKMITSWNIVSSPKIKFWINTTVFILPEGGKLELGFWMTCMQYGLAENVFLAILQHSDTTLSLQSRKCFTDK